MRGNTGRHFKNNYKFKETTGSSGGDSCGGYPGLKKANINRMTAVAPGLNMNRKSYRDHIT